MEGGRKEEREERYNMDRGGEGGGKREEGRWRTRYRKRGG